MNNATLDAFLMVLFGGILLSIVGMLWLQARVPRNSSVHEALFSSGAIYPYKRIVALRARYFLPWVPAPGLSGLGSASSALTLARVGAGVSTLALVSMAVFGVSRV